MTYDDVEEIKELYPQYRQSSFTISHHSSNAKKGKN